MKDNTTNLNNVEIREDILMLFLTLILLKS